MKGFEANGVKFGGGLLRVRRFEDWQALEDYLALWECFVAAAEIQRKLQQQMQQIRQMRAALQKTIPSFRSEIHAYVEKAAAQFDAQALTALLDEARALAEAYRKHESNEYAFAQRLLIIARLRDPQADLEAQFGALAAKLSIDNVSRDDLLRVIEAALQKRVFADLEAAVARERQQRDALLAQLPEPLRADLEQMTLPNDIYRVVSLLTKLKAYVQTQSAAMHACVQHYNQFIADAIGSFSMISAFR
ncbi:MAG: hypothetical protein HC828_18035, partial [Blastochloris sp.]|nr:hypothetical protein [Blastochloris sp.]